MRPTAAFARQQDVRGGGTHAPALPQFRCTTTDLAGTLMQCGDHGAGRPQDIEDHAGRVLADSPGPGRSVQRGSARLQRWCSWMVSGIGSWGLAFVHDERGIAGHNRRNGRSAIRQSGPTLAGGVFRSGNQADCSARITHTSTGNASSNPREKSRTQSAIFRPTPGRSISAARASGRGALFSCFEIQAARRDRLSGLQQVRRAKSHAQRPQVGFPQGCDARGGRGRRGAAVRVRGNTGVAIASHTAAPRSA